MSLLVSVTLGSRKAAFLFSRCWRLGSYNGRQIKHKESG